MFDFLLTLETPLLISVLMCCVRPFRPCLLDLVFCICCRAFFLASFLFIFRPFLRLTCRVCHSFQLLASVDVVLNHLHVVVFHAGHVVYMFYVLRLVLSCSCGICMCLMFCGYLSMWVLVESFSLLQLLVLPIPKRRWRVQHLLPQYVCFPSLVQG